VKEKELPEIKRLVRIAESVIKRRCGKGPYANWVWQAGLIDSKTGELDPRKFHHGYAWVNARTYEDFNKIAENYQFLTSRRRH